MSLRRLNPPLNLLRAFSTVARFGGVSRAAEALHLTQGAVSKQVQELERWIGVPLFERSRKRLTLTPAGERYEKAVRAVLARLEAATLELITSGDGGGALHLSTLPTFGAKWLIPRLPDFQRVHPQITLHFVPFVHGYDFQRPELDCSILFGDGHWPGARSHYLAGQDVALIAPRTGLAEVPIRSPQDLARCTLLRHVSVPQSWLQWSEAHGVRGLDPLAGPQFDQFQTMIRAVMVGMGVALVPRCLVQDEIGSGLVEEPLPGGGYRGDTGYWFCYPEGRGQLATLGHFRNWLLPMAEQAVEATAALQPPPVATVTSSRTG
ncbi:LysR substrate-binding domain-containing protein [Variovorax ginsengisoli]|uniref:DNA-binding transcriptional LysR family regulator n=1 Tax=Variovorax ginsengisoli TaxID=363844 RepID=A0ABT9S761_9BURK|nr:LysR substrate-binding domain-containing protein [Variovorax ginsengisoli]MDP9900195.1 DNA-binding transcriptional LysR family regulator [Variovorax ginsengisoli]